MLRGSGLWLRGILIALAVILVYANSLSGPFVMDDAASIVENSQIREWWRPARLLTSERELPVAGRPLVTVSLAFNYALGELDVRGYHIGNVAVHLGCALLVFGVVRRTLRSRRLDGRLGRKSLDLAFAVALLWAIHPLNTEAVDYLTQRTETMMAFFYLLTVYSSVRAADSLDGKGWPVAAVLSCAAGMACKESMVTAPVAVVLYDRVFLFDSLKEAIRARWRLYAGLAGGWLLLAFLLSSGPRAHSAGFSTSVSPWTYLLNQTVMIVQYLRLAVWPYSLVINYGWPLPLTLRDVLPYALALSGLLAAAALTLIRRPALGFAGAWFFLTLAPTSSIVPIATEVGAERRMYLPLISLIALAVIGGAYLWEHAAFMRARPGSIAVARRRAVGWFVLVVVAIAMAQGTISRNREYESSLRLAQTIVERHPTSVGHHVLAAELIAAGRHDEAMTHLRQALPGAPRAYHTLAFELADQNKWDEVIPALQAFLEAEPLLLEAISARQLLGRAFAAQKRWAEASEQYRLVLTMRPSPDEETTTHLMYADALYAQGAFDQAVAQYRAYLQARPTDVGALTNMAIALGATAHIEEAIAAFRRAVEVRPDDGALHRNLANILFDHGDVDVALGPARRAVELRPSDPEAHDVLGRVLAVQGQTAAAIAQFELALKLNPGAPDVRDHLSRVLRLRGQGAQQAR